MSILSSVPLILYLIAGGLTLAHGIWGKVPLWIPVLLICIGLVVR